MKKNLFKIILALTLTNCSSVPKGTFLGASIGLGASSVLSSNEENSSQKNNILIAGALIGGTIGYFLSKNKIRQEQQLRTLPIPKEFIPRLNKPEVRRVWVPDQISNDEFISGHWKFFIEQPAVWSKEQ